MLAPINIKIFPMNTVNIIVIIKPVIIPVHIQNEAILFAFLCSPAPKALEIHDIPPAMKTIPHVIKSINTGEAKETAAICIGSLV